MKSLRTVLPPGITTARAAKRRRIATDPEIIKADRLLCLDVSSTASGYAFLDWKGNLLAFGVIRPDAKLEAIRRIDDTVNEVVRLLDKAQSDVVVMEFSSGFTARRIRKATGLAVLGQAQGAVWEAARRLGPVITVPETLWTKGKPKKTRCAAIRPLFPDYAKFWAAGKDRGMDAADSIGIGLWYLGRVAEAKLLGEPVPPSRMRRARR